ncbi:hypothetical protein [Persicirhabdus sediminis]|nr:hypothetical protein [Persicirhabdus sediminis]
MPDIFCYRIPFPLRGIYLNGMDPRVALAELVDPRLKSYSPPG